MVVKQIKSVIKLVSACNIGLIAAFPAICIFAQSSNILSSNSI